MLIVKRSALRYSDVTPRSLWLNRRGFLSAFADAALPPLRKSVFSAPDKLNTWDEVTHYNNYYEFGTRKNQPAELAKNFRTSPWTLSLEGAVKKPRAYNVEELMKLAPLEERVYRHRCVEGWSMVDPWAGYSLSELLRKAEPTPKAKYVAFETMYYPAQMPEGVHAGIQLPYREGLRLDEAMHPLTMLTFGMHGQSLPPQDGAPVRLTVPWKYGFKSAKSLVKISLVEEQPVSVWNLKKPNEYGFYANVSPTVDHARWTQATDGPSRRISPAPDPHV
jgi:methionine sulfoxide reductase catalytic subunit